MQSVRSGFQVNLGLMTVPVNLYSVVPSNTGRSMRTLCEQHQVPIKQVYQCPVDAELDPATVKGYEVTKNNFKILTPEDIQETEFAMDAGIDIVAVSAEDVENRTVPGSTMYYMQPHKTAAKAWEILFRLSQDKSRTLVGQTALRKNARRLYRLTVFNDYLVLQEIRFPEHVRTPPERETIRIEKKLMDQAKAVLDAIEIDWDKLDPTDEMLAKFRELASKGDTVTIDTAAESGDTNNVVDLMEALKASIDETKRKAK